MFPTFVRHDGCPQQGNTQLQYEPHKRQGHQARNARAPLPACPGLSLPSARKKPPRQARYSTAEIQDHHLYTWLFLAWPRRL